MKNFYKFLVITSTTLILAWCWEKTTLPIYLLPKPSDILNVYVRSYETILSHTLVTLSEWMVGIFFASLIGWWLGFCLSEFKVLKSILTPLLSAIQTVPYVIYFPLLALWVGIGFLPKVLIIVIACSFPLAVILEKSLNDTKSYYLCFVKNLKLSSWQAYQKIYFKSTLPQFANGLQVSLTYSLTATILAELLGSKKGLGVLIMRSQSQFETEMTFALCILVILLTLSVKAVVSFIFKNILFWKEQYA